VWSEEAGELIAERSESVLHSSHSLLQATKTDSLGTVLGARTVAEYLGPEWLETHPLVWPYVNALEELVQNVPDT
jgi:hypothetical protein